MKRKMGWAALMILSLLPGLAKADDTPMEAEAPIALTSPSAILCEASTGRVVFEKNADERRPVASVNKVMTILLTLEALDEGRAFDRLPLSMQMDRPALILALHKWAGEWFDARITLERLGQPAPF